MKRPEPADRVAENNEPIGHWSPPITAQPTLKIDCSGLNCSYDRAGAEAVHDAGEPGDARWHREGGASRRTRSRGCRGAPRAHRMRLAGAHRRRFIPPGRRARTHPVTAAHRCDGRHCRRRCGQAGAPHCGAAVERTAEPAPIQSSREHDTRDRVAEPERTMARLTLRVRSRSPVSTMVSSTPSGMASSVGMSKRSTNEPAMSAPQPASAHWPSDSCPA